MNDPSSWPTGFIHPRRPEHGKLPETDLVLYQPIGTYGALFPFFQPYGEATAVEAVRSFESQTPFNVGVVFADL